MLEFVGVTVVLRDGARRNFLPGPSHPGVTQYTAHPDETGHWLHVYAVAPSDGGYLAARFAESAVLFQEPLP